MHIHTHLFIYLSSPSSLSLLSFDAVRCFTMSRWEAFVSRTLAIGSISVTCCPYWLLHMLSALACIFMCSQLRVKCLAETPVERIKTSVATHICTFFTACSGSISSRLSVLCQSDNYQFPWSWKTVSTRCVLYVQCLFICSYLILLFLRGTFFFSCFFILCYFVSCPV